MARPLKVCICGGGKSAQIMAVLAASKPSTDVNVLAIFEDEAKQWSKAISDNDMILSIKGPEGRDTEVKAKPMAVSKKPADVVPGSDLIILAVTAAAHEDYLKAILDHIDKRVAIVGLPGLPGFEFLCKSVLGELGDHVTIMSYERSPWISAMVEYGHKVEVIRNAKELSGAVLRGKAVPRKPALMSLQMLLGCDPALMQVRHFLEILFIAQSFLNPAIVYGKWKDWDGKPVPEEPPFYAGVDEYTAKFIENCSKEYQSIASAITSKASQVDLTDVPDILKWMVTFYKRDIEDPSDLYHALTTNAACKNDVHVMKKGKNRFTPDFTCRYLTEDIPNGVIVVKGVAELVEVETPCLDLLIEWAQDKIGKKYIAGGKLTGANVKETRIPQNFGITTVEDLIKGKKTET